MSNSLLEHLSAINDLVEDVLKENQFLRNCIRKQEGGPRSNRPKLSKRDVQKIRGLKRDGASGAELADIFDVNPSTISRTLRGLYNK